MKLHFYKAHIKQRSRLKLTKYTRVNNFMVAHCYFDVKVAVYFITHAFGLRYWPIMQNKHVGYRPLDKNDHVM